MWKSMCCESIVSVLILIKLPLRAARLSVIRLFRIRVAG